MISRNIFQVSHTNVHDTQCGNCSDLVSHIHIWQKFRESNGINKEITKELI